MQLVAVREDLAVSAAFSQDKEPASVRIEGPAGAEEASGGAYRAAS